MSDDHQPAFADPNEARFDRLTRLFDALTVNQDELRALIQNLRERVERLEQIVGEYGLSAGRLASRDDTVS